MTTLYGSVCGRVVGWGEVDRDVEGCHDILPEVGHEGVAIVTDYQAWKAESGRPLHKPLTALHAGGGLHLVTFQPPRGPIKAGENIFEAFTVWQWAYNIYVDYCKSLVRNWKSSNPWIDSFCILRDLTRMARSDE